MLNFEKEKLIESDRYEQRARSLLGQEGMVLGPDGAASQPLVIRAPYLVYEDYIQRSTPPQGRALDVCCGTGLYSLIAARGGAIPTASDIAKHNLVLAHRRAERSGLRLETVVADAEKLPFAAGTFDLVTCAGSLSYVEPSRFLTEVQRVLRPGGWFVCVDSLNHNPVFRLNRYLQYLRGRRTKATIVRMPSLLTLAHLHQEFEATETSFHGSLSFLAPMLKLVLGAPRTARLLDGFDRRTPCLHRWAFKFVFRGRRRAS